MNTASPTPFIAPPQDLWAAPRAWARAFVRRVIGPGRHTRPIESTLPLNPGATTWVDQPLGRRVTCHSGVLWLCFDGEPQDIVLEPGQTHLCTQRSVLSIHALSPSTVRLA
jgi:hypothetical protein